MAPNFILLAVLHKKKMSSAIKCKQKWKHFSEAKTSTICIQLYWFCDRKRIKFGKSVQSKHEIEHTQSHHQPHQSWSESPFTSHHITYIFEIWNLLPKYFDELSKCFAFGLDKTQGLRLKTEPSMLKAQCQDICKIKRKEIHVYGIISSALFSFLFFHSFLLFTFRYCFVLVNYVIMCRKTAFQSSSLPH